MNRRDFVLFHCAVAAVTTAGLAQAQPQSYPARPIRLIVPSTPGGGTDFVGRLIASRLGELNGWTVVPDNRPGANLTLGLGEAVRADPAGHDLVIGQTDNVSLAPLLMKLPFDPVRDLAPVALVATTPIVLVVPQDSPYRTLADVIRAARAAPGTIGYGTSGTGSATHVTIEMLQAEAGVRLQHVPYKGSAQAMADLMGGHLDMAGGSIATAAGLVRSGKLRALAVSSARRSPAMPEVPAVGESGYGALVVYYGVFAPAAIPKPVAARLNSDINRILRTPEARAALLAQGLEPDPVSPEAFAALVAADAAKARQIVRQADIRVE